MMSKTLVYNPFLLKLIHGKAYYMDKLLAIYLPSVSKVKYDIMKWLLIYNYHVSMIMSDIIQLNTLCEKETFCVDLYLVNFEFTLFRLCEHYVKENLMVLDPDTDNGLYQCEAVLKQHVVMKDKGALMRRLCERYVRRVYFDKHIEEYENRVHDRAQLFFNLKHRTEENLVRGIEMNDDVIHYDKTAVMGLMYLYFINEFIGDATRSLHKESLESSFNNVTEKTRAYVYSETICLEEEEDTGVDEDLIFLYSLYDKLTETLNEYIYAWCIKEKATTLNKDFARTETDEERRMRRHNEKYNHYTAMSMPSFPMYPLNDPAYRHFIGEHLDEEDVNNTAFLPLVTGKKFYESVAYEILFHVRLKARHSCDGQWCNTCLYTYTDYHIYEFNKKCHAYRYNKVRYGNDDMCDRLIFDRYLKHTIVEVVPTLKGFVFRIFYHMMLILYHTDIVLKDPHVKMSREVDLFAMVDIGDLITRIIRSHFFSNIEERLQSIIRVCRDDNITKPVMSEKEYVRRLALDMAVLSEIMSGIDKQYMKIEKYERSLSKKVSPCQYNIHTQMMKYLKLLYIYYTRIMHSIAT